MKAVIAAMVLSVSLYAADSATDEVKKAAKKLGDKGSYSWVSNSEAAGGRGEGGGGQGRFRPGPTEGKFENGTIHLVMTRGDNKTEAVLKGGKGAIKTPEGWRSLAEASEGNRAGGQGQQNFGRFLSRMLENYRPPVSEVEDLLAKVKDLKKTDDAYTADLTEQGVKDLVSRGMRRLGGDGPAISNARGKARFWVKDGVLAKYEYTVQGAMDFNGREFNMDRTTTVEIKDAGTTKVSVPEEASKKLS